MIAAISFCVTPWSFAFCKWNFKCAKRIWHVYRIIEQLEVMEEVSMLNNIEFDLWADGYDKTVGISDEENTYPFAGYKKVLGFIFQTIMTVSYTHLTLPTYSLCRSRWSPYH